MSSFLAVLLAATGFDDDWSGVILVGEKEAHACSASKANKAAKWIKREPICLLDEHLLIGDCAHEVGDTLAHWLLADALKGLHHFQRFAVGYAACTMFESFSR